MYISMHIHVDIVQSWHGTYSIMSEDFAFFVDKYILFILVNGTS